MGEFIFVRHYKLKRCFLFALNKNNYVIVTMSKFMYTTFVFNSASNRGISTIHSLRQLTTYFLRMEVGFFCALSRIYREIQRFRRKVILQGIQEKQHTVCR